MGKASDISWTDATFNPWWGCIRVSDGCTNCYAETLAKRWGHNIWGPAKTTQRRHFGPKHWAEPFEWNKQAGLEGKRKRVFCASMADVFEDNPDVVMDRMQLWALIGSTPNLDWLLLTKRPENVMKMIPAGWRSGLPPNVWMGTSTENQEYADKRIPILMQIPARVLFLSIEPQLGPVDLSTYLLWGNGPGRLGISWAITGGESGPCHRPFDLDWARLTRDQCARWGVAWHFKQIGGLHHAAGGCLLDGLEHKEFPPNGLREVVRA